MVKITIHISYENERLILAVNPTWKNRNHKEELVAEVFLRRINEILDSLDKREMDHSLSAHGESAERLRKKVFKE